MTRQEAINELKATHNPRKLRTIERLRVGYRKLTDDLPRGTYIGRDRLREKCEISMGVVVKYFALVEALEYPFDSAETEPEVSQPESSAPDPLPPRIVTALDNVRNALTAVAECVGGELGSLRSEAFVRLDGLLSAQKADYERRLALAKAKIKDLDSASVVVAGESDDNASSADVSLEQAKAATAERDDARQQLEAALAANAIMVAKLDAAEGRAATATRHADQLSAQLTEMALERGRLRQAAERASDLEADVAQLDTCCKSLERENVYLRSTLDSALNRRGEPR